MLYTEFGKNEDCNTVWNIGTPQYRLELPYFGPIVHYVTTFQFLHDES